MHTINTDNAPKALGPYSQAIEHDGMVFLSGQIAIDPTTNEFDKDQTIEVQTRQVLTNLKHVLESAGLSLSNVVKTEIFMTDLCDFKTVNGIYGEFFGEHKPARQTVGVLALPLGAKIEISVIAMRIKE